MQNADITRGDNNCTEAKCYSTGYPATKGYDAVTGLGTPIYKAWAATVAGLPANYNSSSSTTSVNSTTSSSTSTTSTISTSTSTTSSSTSKLLVHVAMLVISVIILI